ncbi:hypothetical protein L798_03249 [Zootermopsis nevadensis]|uniref:Uncharacterized protein n=1 Tax=Zootermopsis nevadensis TaxID=136037 RepID=A0A067RCZ7_ZOONE|nr:hypothetical protein L798_03249 [Zootermopsis nevadensis]
MTNTTLSTLLQRPPAQQRVTAKTRTYNHRTPMRRPGLAVTIALEQVDGLPRRHHTYNIQPIKPFRRQPSREDTTFMNALHLLKRLPLRSYPFKEQNRIDNYNQW